MVKQIKIFFFILTVFLLYTACSNPKTNNANQFVNLIASKKFDEAYDFCFDKDSNIYVVGITNGDLNYKVGTKIINVPLIGGTDIFVLKTDKNGNYQWLKTFGGKHNDEAFSIIYCNNSIYVGGYKSEPVKQSFLLKLSLSGDILKEQLVNSLYDGEILALCTKNDSLILFCGYELTQNTMKENPETLVSKGFVKQINFNLDSTSIKNIKGHNFNEITSLATFRNKIYIAGALNYKPAFGVFENNIFSNLTNVINNKGRALHICATNKGIVVSGEFFQNNLESINDGFIACADTAYKIKWVDSIKSNGNNWSKYTYIFNNSIITSHVVNEQTKVSNYSGIIKGEGANDALITNISFSNNFNSFYQITGKGEQGINKIIPISKNTYIMCGWSFDTLKIKSIKGAFLCNNGDAFIAKINTDVLMHHN
ncbi:MAG: hypothetical protein JSU07_04265 [Bacteroidetes bacterium]|nr:hypothetical protein [Bacteroidota bacterium]